MDSKATKGIPTVYENGVLRPLEPLDLAEHSVVYIQISKKGGELPAAEMRAIVIRLLQEAGLVTFKAEPSTEQQTPISPERRAELGRLFSIGRPLSELIIEEREGR